MQSLRNTNVNWHSRRAANIFPLLPMYVSVLFFVGSGACGEVRKNSAQQTAENEATELLVQDSLMREYLEIQGQDRTIWQKPYEIISLLGPLEDKVVADIGAGSGYFTYRFIRVAKKVIAIDIEPKLIEMIQQEREFYKPEIQQKLEARLALPDNPGLQKNEVDVVFLCNTYCYLHDRVKYLSALKNKFRSGGRIMIVDFKKKMTPIGPDPQVRLDQFQVEKELIEAGYKIRMSNDILLDYQYVIIAEVDY